MTHKEILEYYGWKLLSMPGEVLEIKKEADDLYGECYADGEAALIVIACLKIRYVLDEIR